MQIDRAIAALGLGLVLAQAAWAQPSNALQFHVREGGTASADLFASVTTQPVPEPETYALMLAGLAAVGAIARRRRPSR